MSRVDIYALEGAAITDTAEALLSQIVPTLR